MKAPTSRESANLFHECFYLTFRTKSDEEAIRFSISQSDAVSPPIVSSHLDLIDVIAARVIFHLLDHILEFDCADVAAEEHPLPLHIFPVVVPSGLAERAALFRNPQAVYLSPAEP